MVAPKLRFKEFGGDWEKSPLKNLCKINQGLQIPISERFLEPADNRFFYITNEFLKKDNQNRFYIENPPISVLCKPEDILMTRTGNTGQVVSNVSGAFHNNFFKINYEKELINKNFFIEFLKRDTTQHTILKFAGSSTIPDLNHSDFYKLEIIYPNISEQTKIANFLTKVDQKIEQLTQKHELLTQYKKGMMQKLFSQKLRFKADDGSEFGEWKEDTLATFAEINPKSSELPDKFIYIDLESVISGNLVKKKLIDLENAPSRAQRLIQNHDILFQTVRPYQQNNYYFDTAFNQYSYVASSGYAQIRTNQNSKFLYYLIHTKYFLDNVLNQCTGTSFPAVSSSDLANIKISMPSCKEQTKIANFLSSIDQKIDLTHQQLQQAKQWKKGLLQHMFV